ncbi:MAG TPA: transglutaminase-like domain-containing protein [Verrucomicrobiae bacterium]
MKPPPLLLGAALLFWGWQSGFEAPAVALALALEAPRWVKLRWDFSEADFSRIWVFCTLLFFATAIYAFTSNEGPSQFRNLFQSPNFLTQRNAGTAATRTVVSLFRWLPMVFFLFAAAQRYSTNEGVPVETVSLLLRWRWRRARKPGTGATSGQTVDISYYYFGLCLFSASVHASEGTSFYWGLCGLVGWALWAQRPRRYPVAVWLACLGVAVGLGFIGQKGVARLQGYLGNLNIGQGMFAHARHDPTQSRTDLGKVGGIKASAKIVIRLEAREGAAPPLLRETSYQRFNGSAWLADLKDVDYITVLEEPPNSGTYNLLRGKTNSLRVNIGCYLEGGVALLPLPSGSGRLEGLSASIVSRSPLGGVLEEGPGVVVFDALYGPGATIDSLPDRPHDLAVPPREQRALDQVIGQLDLKDKSQSAALGALNKFFSENFSYSTYEPRAERFKEDETALSQFLLRTRRGHCEYFATAGVLLLRRLDIPARYAVGYSVHEGSAGKFVVRQRDAHAWCLVWDEKRGAWRDIDFTPPAWLQAEAVRRGWFRSLSDLWSRAGFELAKFRWGQTRLRQYLLWGVVPILAVLLFQIIFYSRRRRRSGEILSARTAMNWPGLDSEFYRLEKALAARGLPRLPGEPLSAWVDRLAADPRASDLEDDLAELLLLHYRYRFDPLGLSPDDRAVLRSKVTASLGKLRSTPVPVRAHR